MPPRAILSISLVVLLSASMTQLEPISASAGTTTTVPPLLIPVTLPYEGLIAGEGFSFRLGCDPENGTPDDPTDDIACSSGDHLEYAGHGMPYLYSEAVVGNHDHAWWVAGDRESYRCAYAFMFDKHPNPFGGLVHHHDGHFIARATVVRPLDQGYGTVSDNGMAEAQRWYDGSVYGEGTNEINEESCQSTSLDPDFDYNAYVPKGPELIRVGLFREDGEISDVRDFIGEEGHFEFVSLENFGGPIGPGGATSRITLVRIEPDIEKVSHVIYYDVMNDGRAAVEVDGTIVAESCVPGDPGCVPPPRTGDANDEMFFYRSTNGAYRYYDIQSNANLGGPIRAADSGYSLGWSSITAVDLDGDGQDEMFFYRKTDGAYRYYNVQSDASLGALIRGADSGYSLGWDSITAVDLDGDGQDEIFFYKSHNGSYRYYDIQSNASLGTLIRGGDSGYSLGWSAITAVDLGGDGQDEIFFYKSHNGAYRYYDIQSNASLGTLTRGADSGYSLGWSSITAVDLGGDGQDEMFFYKSHNGSYRYYDIQSNASLGTLIRGADSGYSLGWNAITAVDLD